MRQFTPIINKQTDWKERVARQDPVGNLGLICLSKEADSTLKKLRNIRIYIICKYVKDRLRQIHTTNRMRLQRYNPAQAMSSVFHRFFAYGHKKRSPKSFDSEDLDKRRQLPTLPHCIAVPSAQAGLTSLFGMGRGGTPPQ